MSDLQSRHSMRRASTGFNHNAMLQTELHYYVWGNDSGKRFVWGPYATREIAQQHADKVRCEYEIVALKTGDQSEASRILRGRVLDETGNISETFKRFSHKE